MGLADDFIAKKRQKLEATAQRRKTASEDTTADPAEPEEPAKAAAVKLAAPPPRPASLPPSRPAQPEPEPEAEPVAPAATEDEEEGGPDLSRLVRPREEAAALKAQEQKRDLVKVGALAAGALVLVIVLVTLLTRAPA